jgi:hypothetical protein
VCDSVSAHMCANVFATVVRCVCVHVFAHMHV